MGNTEVTRRRTGTTKKDAEHGQSTSMRDGTTWAFQNTPSPPFIFQTFVSHARAHRAHCLTASVWKLLLILKSTSAASRKPPFCSTFYKVASSKRFQIVLSTEQLTRRSPANPLTCCRLILCVCIDETPALCARTPKEADENSSCVVAITQYCNASSVGHVSLRRHVPLLDHEMCSQEHHVNPRV